MDDTRFSTPSRSLPAGFEIYCFHKRPFSSEVPFALVNPESSPDLGEEFSNFARTGQLRGQEASMHSQAEPSRGQAKDRV
jgi:hypothetical protein